jgi:hypothetical protein
VSRESTGPADLQRAIEILPQLVHLLFALRGEARRDLQLVDRLQRRTAPEPRHHEADDVAALDAQLSRDLRLHGCARTRGIETRIVDDARDDERR